MFPVQDHFTFLTLLTIICKTFADPDVGIMALYVMLSIFLSISTCATASLFCARFGECTAQFSAPYFTAGSPQEFYTYLSLQTDDEVAFEEIPVENVFAKSSHEPLSNLVG